ncbi:MAG: 2-oxoglutarate dehydrogenase complex dihydrolipoyllysine-residue succinyltransferase [Bacteroidota bacterium]
MATNIVVPEMGESVLEATVAHWFKKEGDPVSVGDVLVELETDKVNLEVGAKSPGVLAHIDAAEGQDVKVGDVLGVIEEKAGVTDAAPNESPSEKPAEQAPAPAPQRAASEPPKEKSPQAPPPAEKHEPAGTNGRGGKGTPQISPVAYRLAQEHDVDITQVSGTGPEGRVSKADVEHYLEKTESKMTPVKEAPEPGERLESPAPAASPERLQRPQPPQPSQPETSAPGQREERERMSRRRRTIAQRLLEAHQGTAMLTTFNEADMSAIMDLRRRRNEEFQKRYGVKLGIVSFFVRAAISALKAFPRLNAEIQGDEIVLKRYYDIGMAIGSEEGLVVPVIRDADKLSFAEIENRVKDLVSRTEQGRLSIEDLRGGTFTITNGGVFGSLLSTPILNPPQVGILGLHKIEDRPVALNGQVVIRPMMYLALSYDHRIVDGREAVQFLVHVKQVIEDPGLMLLEG